jgi:hypothetical protein
MDTKEWAIIMRLHSKHLQNLLMRLTTDTGALEQTVGAVL